MLKIWEWIKIHQTNANKNQVAGGRNVRQKALNGLKKVSLCCELTQCNKKIMKFNTMKKKFKYVKQKTLKIGGCDKTTVGDFTYFYLKNQAVKKGKSK